MSWGRRFGRKTKGPSEEALAKVLDKLDRFSGYAFPGKQEPGFRGTVMAVKKAVGSKREKEKSADEANGEHDVTSVLPTIHSSMPLNYLITC